MGIWRSIARESLILRDRLVGQMSWQASRRHFRSNYIVEKWDGARDLGNARRIAILVHFSSNRLFAEYFIYLLRALDEAGFSTIVVSNAKRLDRDSVASILPWCGRVLHRKNIGYDFGAWRDAIAASPEIARAEQLLIVNDSIFGPTQNLAEILDRCRFDQADVWGMTDSFDARYHLQSYFVLFGPKVLRSQAFAKFWRSARYVGHKHTVIHKLEIGLSQAMLKAGFKLQALYPYRRLSRAVIDRALAAAADDENRSHPLYQTHLDRLLQGVNAGYPLNPTHYFWDYLITELRFPFIKRELLERNPVAIPLLANWATVIENSSDYPVRLIEEHLQTSSRNRVF